MTNHWALMTEYFLTHFPFTPECSLSIPDCSWFFDYAYLLNVTTVDAAACAGKGASENGGNRETN